jgi:hypothetical protein
MAEMSLEEIWRMIESDPDIDISDAVITVIEDQEFNFSPPDAESLLSVLLIDYNRAQGFAEEFIGQAEAAIPGTTDYFTFLTKASEQYTIGESILKCGIKLIENVKVDEIYSAMLHPELEIVIGRLDDIRLMRQFPDKYKELIPINEEYRLVIYGGDNGTAKALHRRLKEIEPGWKPFRVME